MESKTFLEWFANAIETEIISTLSIWFVLGIILFCIGLFALTIHVLYQIKGRRLEGTLVGAVKKTRIKKKERDGKVIEKVKETIHPIYDYIRSNGSARLEIGSDSITSSEDLKTGQTVNLLVWEHKLYDDVVNADKKSALYVGLVLMGIGGFLMSIMLMAYGFNITFWISVVLILIPGLYKLVTFLLAGNKSYNTIPESKNFSEADIQPIEYFFKN